MQKDTIDATRRQNAFHNPFRWMAVGILLWIAVRNIDFVTDFALRYSLAKIGANPLLIFWVMKFFSAGVICLFIVLLSKQIEYYVKHHADALRMAFQLALVLFISCYALQLVVTTYLFDFWLQDMDYTILYPVPGLPYEIMRILNVLFELLLIGFTIIYLYQKGFRRLV